MIGDWLYIFGVPMVIAYLTIRWMEARNAAEVHRLMVELRDARKGGLVQSQELVQAREMLAMAIQSGPHSVRADIHHMVSEYLRKCHAWEES